MPAKKKPIKRAPKPKSVGPATDLITAMGQLTTAVIALTKQVESIEAVTPETFEADEYDRNKEADMMFEALRDKRLASSTRSFLSDLEYDYNTRGTITTAQFVALRRNYDKYINGIPFQA